MRPSQKQNRARGRGNRNKPSGNVVNRVFESAGPEGKVRGTPQQIIDKYLTLSRDAQTSGDRVMSENFLQHAEHYQRILLDAQGTRDEQRREQHHDQGNSESDGRDDNGRDEAASDETDEAQASGRRDQRRDRERRPHGEPRADHGGGQHAGEGGDSRDANAEVSGLTTIDSGSDDGENLLVEADELGASQPPRRRRNQRRNRDEEQKTEADAQSD